MHIGTIGAAAVAQAIATQAIKAGHQVTLSNSRGPDTLADTVAGLGTGARAATRKEAAAADIVLLATPWVAVPKALAGLADWNGRILMDATNHFLSYAPDFRRDDLGDSSSSEIVAGLAPGARVVKVFNTVMAKGLAADPAEHGGKRVLFISGDDANARKTVADLVTSFGFAPIDLGYLAEGGRLQQLGGPLAGPYLTQVN
ncbi:NADPH-dependent F420 reductase [uncultured Sphingomonas sp.]|uniref:NADPH-dependent F420 reductase n=1 Tax=uncultured Sphingomonas sp. TaxID=158754 RepID=UPI0035CB0D4F